jgi:hypothetical protein
MRIILLTLLSLPLFAQTPSDCSLSPQLLNAYEWDIANMAIRRMQQTNSPSLSLVTIPQTEKDFIEKGLAAVLNSGLPEADSVFNLYCVHDRTSSVMTWQSMMVWVDTSVAWTAAWQNLTALTGNPYIDSLVNKYGLSVTGFTNYSFGSIAEVNINRILNLDALLDSIELEPAVSLAEANYTIGLAGKITYNEINSVRYYNFRFEFSDCFDGCDNYREWQFAVNPDCSVNYLGFTEFGFFGVQPLPAPSNCNLFTAVQENMEDHLRVYPNPASDRIFVEQGEFQEFIITDLLGRTLKSGQLETDNFIDIISLVPGIYILNIKGESKQSFKLVKE